MALRQAVDGLTGQLKESQEDRSAIHTSLRRNKWFAGFIVAAVLIVGGIGWQARNASNDAATASAKVASVAHANYETCLANNRTREDNRNLWAAVIVTLQPLTVSPQGKQFVAEIQHDVELATSPRVCRAA